MGIAPSRSSIGLSQARGSEDLTRRVEAGRVGCPLGRHAVISVKCIPQATSCSNQNSSFRYPYFRTAASRQAGIVKIPSSSPMYSPTTVVNLQEASHVRVGVCLRKQLETKIGWKASCCTASRKSLSSISRTVLSSRLLPQVTG